MSTSWARRVVLTSSVTQLTSGALSVLAPRGNLLEDLQRFLDESWNVGGRARSDQVAVDHALRVDDVGGGLLQVAQTRPPCRHSVLLAIVGGNHQLHAVAH